MNKSDNIQDYVESIKNYENDLVKIENFIEGVRTLPGFYIGATGNIGWLACIREIFQNAIDEMKRPYSPCHYIKIVFDERNQQAIIEDTGRGIPLGKIIEIYTSERMSSNYHKKAGDSYTSGTHGVGSGVALALSKYFSVSSYVLGKAHQVQFDSGIPRNDIEEKIPCPEGRQGTTVIMTPDLDIMGNVNLTCKEVFDMVFKIFTLINIGDRIDFIGIDSKGNKCIEEEMINKDGIVTDLIVKTQSPLIPPIQFQDDNGTMMCEIAFTYDASDLSGEEDITSFGNFTNTTDGTHVQGFLSGICIYFKNYMNKIYLGEKSKITITNIDVRTGLKAVVNAAHINPIFKGQFKGVLSNDDIEPYIRNFTIKSLENWAKLRPGDLQKIAKFLKDVAELRMKSDTDKVKLSSKYETNVLTGRPKGFVPASGKKELELVIVEGKSALGSTKNSRDYLRQAIFPIRGKLPNAYTTSKTKFLSNQEVAAIISLVGGGYGKNFDITKVRWEKIILLADADPDGSHIDTLLLRLFLLYMPEIITSGKLYRAVPPLFGIKNSKGNKYFATKLDFAKYIQSLFNNKYSFTKIDGKRFSNNEASAFFVKNLDYSHDLTVLSNIFAIDPYLLEIVLFYLASQIIIQPVTTAGLARKAKEITNTVKQKDEPLSNEEGMDENLVPVIKSSVFNTLPYCLRSSYSIKQLNSIIKKQYKFVSVTEQNSCALIQGLVNSKYQYFFINDYFIRSCMNLIINIMKNDSMYYILNGEKVTLFTLMKTFESLTPNGLTRFKGLGEQNPAELGESVLRPDSDRTLVQYTIDSVKEEIESLRYIDSTMAVLINQVKITKQDIE